MKGSFVWKSFVCCVLIIGWTASAQAVDVCNTDADCESDLYCTETCDPSNPEADAKGCVLADSCDDSIDCTYDYCIDASMTCQNLPVDANCQDGQYCNGAEICSATLGCIDGPDPCSDAYACTDDCDEDTDTCPYTPNDSLCDDSNTCTAPDSCSPGSPGTDADGCLFTAVEDGTNCELDGGGSGACLGGECFDGCISDANCDDGIPCTEDLCNLNTLTCYFVNSDAACDDDVFCNGAESCEPSNPGADGNGCVAGSDPCDDGASCTSDSCEESTDSCTNTPDDGECDNEIFCDGEETCDPTNPSSGGDGCVAGSNPCLDSYACTVDECDEGNDSCSNTPSDAYCDNEQACDGEETCDPSDPSAGVDGCLDGSSLNCNDGISCTVDSCDDASGCINAPDHAFCDDLDPCTTDSCDTVLNCVNTPLADGSRCEAPEQSPKVCQDGVCVAACTTNQDCDDGIACTTDICDGETLLCSHTPNNNVCNNSDPCDGVEVCNPDDPGSDGNGCVAGQDLDCDDGVDCTTDSCTPGVGCSNEADDSYCDDNNVCNGSETCDAVQGCLAGTPLNCADAFDCTADSCDMALGCQHTPNDAVCDDHTFCNGVETCSVSLGCVNGTPPSCDDGVACTVDSCNTSSDSCDNEPSNTYCNDDAYCNGVETCSPESPGANAQGCLAGTAPDCSDSISCTVDSCDEPSDTCVHEADHSACDNGLYCDGYETCDETLGCQDGIAVFCSDDGFSCTQETCDEESDRCISTPIDSRCNNNQYCDGEETCDPTNPAHATNGCVAGEDIDCADEYSCTIDGCDEQLDSCVHAPDNSVCNNNLFCDGVEVCNPDDGSADGNGCVEGTPPDCDDGIDCTLDECNNNIGFCVYTGRNELCDNGLDCDGAEICDTELGCVDGIAVNCNDDVGCTRDSCQESALGPNCVNEPFDSDCSDGQYCNGQETCDPVRDCQDGESIVCTDGVACTVDECDEEQDQCTYTPDDGLCTEDPGVCRTLVGCDPDDGCMFANRPDGETCDVNPEEPEICQNGVCVPGCQAAEDCDDGIECTLNTCVDNWCVFVPQNELCQDDSYCNGAEVCSAVSGCIAGSEPDCDDELVCTRDQCNEAIDGCEHIPENSWCNDGLYCNGVEICDPQDVEHDENGCVPGTAIVCEDDGIDCTEEECSEDSHACEHIANDELCSDNQFCTGVEICHPVDGCQPGALPNCSDDVDCTVDSCDSQSDSCVHEASDALCSDNVFCNGVEICDEQTGCQDGPDPSCEDGVDCTVDRCDTESDTCANEPDDSACDDLDYCTGVETCDVSQGCVSGTAVTCDDGFSCTTDTCSTELARCVYTPENSACDNDAYCDGVETCDPENPGHDDNGCVPGTDVVCEDAFTCTQDRCDEDTDQCAFDPVDANCANAFYCDGAETCDPQNPAAAADGCVPGTDPCDDGFACTADSCDEPTDVCTNTPQDSACDDTLYCTGAESCDPQNGSADEFGCVAGTPPDCADGIACTVDDCSNESSSCTHTPDDSACADEFYCNGVEICDAQTGCQDGPDPDCSDAFSCTVDSCDEANDECVHEPVNSSCDDGVYCNGDEVCSTTQGCVTIQRNCSDGVDCTEDSCVENEQRCEHTPQDSECDDDNPCTAPDVCDLQEDCQTTVLQDGTTCDIDPTKVETCQQGECVPNCVEHIDCDDGQDCTTDTCNSSGVCEYQRNDDLCNEGRAFCDPIYECKPFTGCVAGDPPDCNDDIACTIDECDTQQQACVHTPDDTACDDGKVCTVDSCDDVDDCQHDPVADDTPCDVDPTRVESCQNGLCVADCLEDEDCDDEQECTTDSCSAQGVCEFEPDHDSCNEGLTACDTPYVCIAFEGCVESDPIDCDDDEPCTTDTCDDTLGCQYEALPDGTICDDGWVCDAGVCVEASLDGDLEMDIDLPPDGDMERDSEGEQPPDGDEDLDHDTELDIQPDGDADAIEEPEKDVVVVDGDEEQAGDIDAVVDGDEIPADSDFTIDGDEDASIDGDTESTVDGDDNGDGGGCSCNGSASTPQGLLLMALALLAAWMRRRMHGRLGE